MKKMKSYEVKGKKTDFLGEKPNNGKLVDRKKFQKKEDKPKKKNWFVSAQDKRDELIGLK